MKDKWVQLLCRLNQKLFLFLGIGLGAVLFVMVFEPFLVEPMDFESRVLFASGFGIILFLVIFFIGIACPSFFGDHSHEEYSELKAGIRNFLIWFLSSLFISLYLNFSRSVALTSFDIYKTTLICLLPPLIIGIHDKLLRLKEKNEALSLFAEILKKKIEVFENIEYSNSVDFFSENKNEKFSLLSSNILFIRSADNYAEIHYRDGSEIKKKLIRNTLKNIEQQIKAFPNLIRCHRVSIVNLQNIEKLVGNCNHQTLIIKGTEEQIPVSRSYIMKIKEAL